MYTVEYRAPTDPRADVERGLSLRDSEASHRDWIKEEARRRPGHGPEGLQSVEACVEAGYRVEVEVTGLGRRWVEHDDLIGQERRFRVGRGTWRALRA